MFFKVPLEAHETKRKETNDQRSDGSTKTQPKWLIFLPLGGPKGWFFDVNCVVPLQTNLFPAAAGSTFLQNHVNKLKKENVTSQASDGKYEACMCGLSGAEKRKMLKQYWFLSCFLKFQADHESLQERLRPSEPKPFGGARAVFLILNALGYLKKCAPHCSGKHLFTKSRRKIGKKLKK